MNQLQQWDTIIIYKTTGPMFLVKNRKRQVLKAGYLRAKP